MTHPTTAGVLASFASLGDVIVSEPGALLAFTGPARRAADDAREASRRLRPGRVERPLRPRRRDRPAARAAPLPGPPALALFDMATESTRGTVEQLRLRERLARLRELPLLARGRRLRRDGEAPAPDRPHRRGAERRRGLARGRARAPPGSARTRSTTSSGSSTTSSSCTATARSRTTRRSSPASAASTVATVALVGHQKGRDIRERTHRNFGMTYPEGYRKAMRVMELADRHGFPVITLVDTPGAYPGRRRRAARAGRLDRPLPARDAAARRPDGRLHHRRGRLGRRGRDRRRGPRAHAGERDLLGHLARRLRRHPLAGRRRGEEGGRGVQAGRRHCLELGVIDGDRPRAAGRRARRITTRRRAPRRGARGSRSTRSKGMDPDGARARTAREVPRHGRSSSSERAVTPCSHSIHRVFPAQADLYTRPEAGFHRP